MIVFISLHDTKLRPAIAGRTVFSCGLFVFQLQAEEPATGKRSLITCIATLYNTQMDIKYRTKLHYATEILSIRPFRAEQEQ